MTWRARVLVCVSVLVAGMTSRVHAQDVSTPDSAAVVAPGGDTVIVAPGADTAITPSPAADTGAITPVLADSGVRIEIHTDSASAPQSTVIDTIAPESTIRFHFEVHVDSVQIMPFTGDTLTYEFYPVAQCVQAVLRVAAATHRTGPDTIRYVVEHDTLPEAAVATARRCVARFNVANTAPRDLIFLAQLYLAAGDDASASAAVERRLAEDRAVGPMPLARTLRDVVSLYLDAQPHRIDVARTYLAQLDALPPDSATDVARVGAHSTVASYLFNVADDDTAASTDAKAVLVASQRLTPHDRREFMNVSNEAYTMLARVAADTGGVRAARRVFARARADLAPLLSPPNNVPDSVAFFAAADTVYSLFGTPAEPLRGGRWLGAPASTVRPTHDRVSLIVFVPERFSMPMFRRLVHEFGDRLELSFVTQTVGYFEGQGPVSADKEIAYLDRYLRKNLAAPAPVLVYETVFHELPDDRRDAVPSLPQRAYKTNYGVAAVLVDRAGIIRRVYTDLNESRLERHIQQLF